MKPYDKYKMKKSSVKICIISHKNSHQKNGLEETDISSKKRHGLGQPLGIR